MNGLTVDLGTRVNAGDDVRLDGHAVRDWERLIVARLSLPNCDNSVNNALSFVYLKYWKPIGVTCTTDLRDGCNILTAGKFTQALPNHRIFPVGRLDKDSTGLILLTSDGRVNNALLRQQCDKEKVY